jgi:hypothetical protein
MMRAETYGGSGRFAKWHHSMSDGIEIQEATALWIAHTEQELHPLARGDQ